MGVMWAGAASMTPAPTPGRLDGFPAGARRPGGQSVDSERRGRGSDTRPEYDRDQKT